VRCEFVVGGYAGTVLESADGGGSCGDDATSFTLCPVDGFSSRGWQSVVLLVEMDVSNAFDADGLEGPETYMQRDSVYFDSAAADLIEDGLV